MKLCLLKPYSFFLFLKAYETLSKLMSSIQIPAITLIVKPIKER